jgi:hypothetical protein
MLGDKKVEVQLQELRRAAEESERITSAKIKEISPKDKEMLGGIFDTLRGEFNFYSEAGREPYDQSKALGIITEIDKAVPETSKYLVKRLKGHIDSFHEALKSNNTAEYSEGMAGMHLRQTFRDLAESYELHLQRENKDNKIIKFFDNNILPNISILSNDMQRQVRDIRKNIGALLTNRPEILEDISKSIAKQIVDRTILTHKTKEYTTGLVEHFVKVVTDEYQKTDPEFTNNKNDQSLIRQKAEILSTVIKLAEETPLIKDQLSNESLTLDQTKEVLNKSIQHYHKLNSNLTYKDIDRLADYIHGRNQVQSQTKAPITDLPLPNNNRKVVGHNTDALARSDALTKSRKQVLNK